MLLRIIPLLLVTISSVKAQNIITFSHSSGFYTDSFLLILSSADSVFYTTNGSTPSPQSQYYNGAILIKSRLGEKNNHSNIKTTDIDSSSLFYWKHPASDVFKITTLRACSYKNGIQTSPVYTATYLVDDSLFTKYSLPIISIVMDSLNLFSYDSGIYISGKYYDPFNPYYSGNYNKRSDDWEKPAYMEFFDTEGKLVLSQNIGIKINGGISRCYPQKSLRLYAREEYGKDHFEYPFFKDRNQEEYKRIVLKSPLADWSLSMFKDELIHDFVFKNKINMGVQLSQATIVFINGEYWGIHNIREREDKYYLETNNKANPDNIDLLENNYGVEEGDTIDYALLMNYIETHAMNEDESYDYVKSKIDINNYIDYQITEIYFANYDWPGNNVTYWKSKADTSQWRWMLHDMDGSMGNPDFNTYKHATEAGNTLWPNPDWSTFLFRNLLENEQFSKDFMMRFEYLLNHTFIASNFIHSIDSFEQLYSKEVKEHSNRWGYPNDYEEWENNVQSLKNFVTYRNEYLYELFPSFNDSIGEFMIYPNPCEGKLYFKGSSISKIEIYNSSGSRVMEKLVEVATNEYIELEMDVSFLSSGVYVLKVYFSNTTQTTKLLIATNNSAN